MIKMNQKQAIRKANQILKQYNDWFAPKKVLCVNCEHEIDTDNAGRTSWLHKTKKGLCQRCECGCIRPSDTLPYRGFLKEMIKGNKE